MCAFMSDVLTGRFKQFTSHQTLCYLIGITVYRYIMQQELHKCRIFLIGETQRKLCMRLVKHVRHFVLKL